MRGGMSDNGTGSGTQTCQSESHYERTCSKCGDHIGYCHCYAIREDIEDRKAHWLNVKTLIMTSRYQPLVPINRKTINGGRRQ